MPPVENDPVAGSGGDAQGGTGGSDPVEQGGAGGSAGGGETSLLPSIDIVDEADTDCAPVGGSGVELLSPQQATVPFDRLVRIGARRAGGGSMAGAAFTFDLDGKKSDLVTVGSSFNFIASEGERLGMIGQSEDGIVYGRFDEKGKPVGDLLLLGTDAPANLAIGGGNGEALAVWGVPGRMRARGIGADGEVTGPAFDFGVGSIDNYFTGSVERTDDGFAIAWTGNPTPGEYRTTFMTVAGEEHSLEKTLVQGSTSHRAVKLARTKDGYALLVNVDSVPPTPVVVMLDDEGEVVGSAHRFLGAGYGWDLAVHEDEVGLVARRASGEIAFRALDGAGAPVAPWRCVTPPSDDLYQQAAIDGDDEGYAVLYRTPEGAEALSILDRVGSAKSM